MDEEKRSEVQVPVRSIRDDIEDVKRDIMTMKFELSEIRAAFSISLFAETASALIGLDLGDWAVRDDDKRKRRVRRRTRTPAADAIIPLSTLPYWETFAEAM